MLKARLAQFAGVPPSTAARLLADLVDAGIVLAEPIGGALAYRMNTDHLTSRAISQLASVRFDLIREIKEEIKTWDTPAVDG